MRPTTIDGSQIQLRDQARTLRRLLPYLWPHGRSDLRARVLFAVAFLVAAKLANVYVPLILRSAVDELSPETGQLVALPLGLLLAYGAARVMALAFGELRDAVFARVAQHAIRRVALQTFHHLHRLSLRFHLDRQTGGLSRAIERGTKGIEFLLSFVIFNIVPTLFEILLVCGILWFVFDCPLRRPSRWAPSWSTATTPSKVTELAHRLFAGAMNESDSEANTKAIDSLLNLRDGEVLQQRGAWRPERLRRAPWQRYEIRRHQAAAQSLALLNVGQNDNHLGRPDG